MPALTLSTIRQPYSYQGWLTVVPEPVVMTGTLSATPSFPALTLAYTVASGSHAAIETGMEVVISSSGTVKGRLRVAPGTISATSLPVNEFDAGRLNAAAGDTITVLRSWRLRDRLVAANAAFDRDSRVTYASQNELIAPVANAGGPWAGWADAGQSYATVTLDAAESFAVDPDSGGTLSYAWNVGDGTIVTGTVASSAPVVQFPVGARWVTLTVTDASNGQTAVKHVPIIVHGPGNLPHEVVMAALSGTRRDGWSASFELPAGADPPALPDGALVVYHEDERYGGTLGSYGHPVAGRSRVKFVGYVVSDTVEVDAERNRVRFDAVSPLALLAELPGFSQALTAVADPSTWLEYQTGLSVVRAMVHILRWGTTLLDVHDLMCPAPDRVYPKFYVQQATPAAQVQELAEANDCELTCDRTGRLTIAQHPHLRDTAGRSALTTTATLTSDDRVRFQMRRAHRFRAAQLEAQGVTAAGSGLFSRAPAAPAEGPTFATHDRLIVTDQADLNARAGRRFARENATFFGQPAPEVTADLPGGYDCFDFHPEWLALSVSASGNKRGLLLDSARGVIERIAVEHDAETGSKQVTITWQAETDGPSGVTYVPPARSETGLDTLPQYSYGSLISVPTPTPITLPLWNGVNQMPITIYEACAASNRVVRVTGLVGGSPSFTEIHDGTITGSGRWAASDPYNYKRFFVLTTTGLFKTDDKTAATPTWTQVATLEAITGASGRYGFYLRMSHNKRGWIAIISGSYCCVTFDYGATWSQHDMSSGVRTYWVTEANRFNMRDAQARFAISNHNSATVGHVWATDWGNYGGGYGQHLYQSTDWGQTWATAYVNTTGASVLYPAGPGSICIPYRRDVGVDNANGAGHLIYWLGGNDAGRWHTTVITDSGGSEATSGTLGSEPTGGYFHYGSGVDPGNRASPHLHSYHAFTANGQKLATTANDIWGNPLIALSSDGGLTWEAKNAPGGVGQACINGFSLHDRFYLRWSGWGVGAQDYFNYGEAGTVRYTPDDGDTWIDVTPPTFEYGSVAYAEADLSAFQ